MTLFVAHLGIRQQGHNQAPDCHSNWISFRRLDQKLLQSCLKLRPHLEAHGIVDRKFYQQHPPRAEYLMTEKGTELGQVLRAMAEWGHKHIPGTVDPEEAHAKLVASSPLG